MKRYFPVIFFLLASLSSQVYAQPIIPIDTSTRAIPATYQQLLDQGASQYNDEDYYAATESYIKAIQAAPWLSQAYKNLARTYFYLSDFESAAYYYNLYLTDQTLDRTSINDAGVIKRELSMALSRIPGEVLPLEHPKKETFRKQYEALTASMTPTSSNPDPGLVRPWGAYQALLRANYATPDLILLRNQLANLLTEHITAQLAPPHGIPTPRLSLEAIEQLSQRLQELRSISIDPSQIAWAENRQLAVSTIQAVATHNTTQAFTYLDSSIDANPDLNYLIWYKIAAYFDDGQWDRALETLNSPNVQESIDQQKISPSYFDVYKGAILHAKGEYTKSTRLYWDVVKESTLTHDPSKPAIESP